MNSRVKLTDFGLSKGSKDTGQHNESLFSHCCVLCPCHEGIWHYILILFVKINFF